MKTKSIVMIAAAMILASAFAAEPGTPKVVVVNQKSGVFKVIYEGPKASKVNLKIFNASRELVYQENVKGVNGFIRPVNFTGMQPGEYTVEVTDESGKQIRKISYQSETSIKGIHVARMSSAGKYLLAVTNTGAEEINVKIFDGQNNLVHNENRAIQGNFGLVYDLSKVSGVPTFEVTDKTGATKVIKH